MTPQDVSIHFGLLANQAAFLEKFLQLCRHGIHDDADDERLDPVRVAEDAWRKLNRS